MKFTPKTETQIAEENLWAAGEYGFEVTEAVDAVSKSGNEMIKLDLRVFNTDGGFRFVTDYLLESVAYKLRHACEALNLLAKYEAGEIVAEDFVGRTGNLKLKIDAAKDGYAAKNSVQDYVPKAVAQGKHEAKKANGYVKPSADMDQDIPW